MCAAPTRYCDTTAGQCVQCLATANCVGVGTGDETCNTTTHTCVAGVACTTDAQCGGRTPYCSTAGECVACVGNANCTGANTTCDMTTGTCVVTCTSDAQCGGGGGVGGAAAPYCNTTTMRCVECLSNANCTGGGGAPGGGAVVLKCDTTTDTCVECVTSADCTMGRTCNAEHICMVAVDAAAVMP